MMNRHKSSWFEQLQHFLVGNTARWTWFELVGKIFFAGLSWLERCQDQDEMCSNAGRRINALDRHGRETSSVAAVDSECFTGRPEVASIEAHVVVTWHRGFSFTPFWNGVPMERSKENVGTRVQCTSATPRPLFWIVLDAELCQVHLLEVIKNTDRWRYITFGPIVTSSYLIIKTKIRFVQVLNFIQTSIFGQNVQAGFHISFTKVSCWALG